MKIEKQLQDIVEKDFNPVRYELINESDDHIGHAGHDGSGDSHFKLIVVSEMFDGYNRIQRHRLMHAAVDHLYSSGLHALSIKLITPAEDK